MKLLSIIALSATVFLAACGGGGDSEPVSSPAPAPVDTVSGLYELRLNNDPYARATTLILSYDGYAELYGGAYDIRNGEYYGYVIANGNSANVEVREYDFYGSLLDYRVTPNSLLGSASDYGSVTKDVTFDFNKKLSITQVAGRWQGAVVGNQAALLQIDNFGNFVVNAGGCATSGSLQETGKNYLRGIFTVSNSSICATPGLTGTIVGVYHNGSLFALGQSAGRTKVVGFSGTR